MSFKEELNKDVKNTFFNLNEFGEEAIVNDKKMTVVIDGEELQKQNIGKSESLARGVLLFYVELSYFDHIPQAHKLMKFNKDTYKIEDVKEEEGVLAITLGRYSG